MAQITLALGNLGLVRKVARKFTKHGHDRGPLEYEDFFQEGYLEGLTRAVSLVGSRYDPAKGEFSTFAYPWIVAAVIRAISGKGGSLIYHPAWFKDLLRAKARAENKLESILGRKPNGDELAAEMDIEPEEFDKLLNQGEVKTVYFSTLIPKGAGRWFDPIEVVDKIAFRNEGRGQSILRPTENEALNRISRWEVTQRIVRLLTDKQQAVFEGWEDFFRTMHQNGAVGMIAERLGLPQKEVEKLRHQARFNAEPVIEAYNNPSGS